MDVRVNAPLGLSGHPEHRPESRISMSQQDIDHAPSYLISAPERPRHAIQSHHVCSGPPPVSGPGSALAFHDLVDVGGSCVGSSMLRA